MHHIWNSFKLSTPFCTTLKPKCRTEILVAGKGMRQWKPQGQLRTISPWDTWYNSSYNTTPLKINSIKLLYSYVDCFHAVAALPFCTSVSTCKHKQIRSKLRTRKLDFLGKGTWWHNTLYRLSYLLLVNYGTKPSSKLVVGNACKLGTPSWCPSIVVNSLSGIYAHKVPPTQEGGQWVPCNSCVQSQMPEILHDYHVFTCSLGKIDCSHANNTINGLIRAILDLPVVAVFLRQDLKKSRKWTHQINH